MDPLSGQTRFVADADADADADAVLHLARGTAAACGAVLRPGKSWQQQFLGPVTCRRCLKLLAKQERQLCLTDHA